MTTVEGPRIGLVGAGGISSEHLPSLLRLGSEVAVFSEVGAEALVARYGGSVASTMEELLDRSDVIDVVTPTATHADIIARSLRAGKDVISEKPLTRDTATAQDLIKLAVEEGRQLLVAHVVRYFPAYSLLHDAVSGGLLGSIAVQRFSRCGAYPLRTSWFADRGASGGVVLDQMIHDLDIARWIGGEVVQVSAVSALGGSSQGPVETAYVLLTHASGVISQVSGIWGPQHLRFTTSYSVAGTLGTLEHDSFMEQNVRADLMESAGGGGALPDVDPAQDPYFLELQELIAAIGGSATPRVTAEDAVAAVCIANAALDSIDLGIPVELRADRKVVES